MIIVITGYFLVVACTKNDPAPKIFDLDYMSHIFPENFVDRINNPFLPFTPGSTYTYLTETAEGVERTEITVLNETRIVMGIETTIVTDKVYLNDVLVEDTDDWYVQDKDGNVWYFGEEVDNYKDGVLTDHYGSWEAGVDGAEPGILMLANPVIGTKYRQEFYVGEAEDEGEIVGKNEKVIVIAGTFTGCLKIRETNPLDPTFLEFKYYAKGVGLVKVDMIDEPIEYEQLSAYSIK